MPNYRNVFISGNKLDGYHADTDNGYSHAGKKIFDRKNREAKKFFPRFKSEMDNAMKAKGYTKTVMLQADLCAAFFTDSKRGVFGFFWDGAEQFVCPYENVIDVFLSDDAHMRTRTGRGQSGQTYVPASSMKLAVSFFTKAGTVETYTLALSCRRSYHYIGSRKKDSHYLTIERVNRELDSDTRTRMEQIRIEILSLRALAPQIQDGSIPVQELDIVALDKQAEGSKARYEKNKAEVTAIQQGIVKRAIITKSLLIGVPIALWVILLIILFTI